MSTLVVGTCLVMVADAALPPQYRNQNDLKVIVDYIYSNADVSRSLKKIDFTRKVVYYSDCRAYFYRKEVKHNKNRERAIGSRPRLQLGRVVCPKKVGK